MENIGNNFAIGIVSGFFQLLPLLITILLFKYTINKLTSKKQHKRKFKTYNHRRNFTKSDEYLSVTEIANYFNIQPKHLNIIFSQLNWCYKSNKWWIATDLGILLGAKQYYDLETKNKYVKWEASIKEDEELISKINQFKK